MLAYLLQGLSLGLSAAASPGPFQAFIIGKTIKNGWRRTLPAVLAPLISDGPIITLMVLVLNNLPPGMLRAIQVAGGCFVLFLGWKAILAYRNFKLTEIPDETRQTLWQAVATNFLAPGPYIFWSMIAGPVLVKAWNEAPSNGLAFLLGFYFTMTSALVILVIFFGAARQLGPRANRVMLGLSGLGLLGFGIYQLWQGIMQSPVQ